MKFRSYSTVFILIIVHKIESERHIPDQRLLANRYRVHCSLRMLGGFLPCYDLVGFFLYLSVVTVDCMGFPCYAIRLFVMPVCSE